MDTGESLALPLQKQRGYDKITIYEHDGKQILRYVAFPEKMDKESNYDKRCRNHYSGHTDRTGQ